MNVLAIVYVVGVALGLMCADARPVHRFLLALLWPLGPVAFAITLGVLCVASLIAFPLVAGTLLIASVVLWTLL